MQRIVSGIQQVGIGVVNANEAFAWYKDIFGFDIQVFADAAEAALMLPYTGGQPHQRYAILALNLQGGGGLEIWQYTSRVPQPPVNPLVWGQPGIMAIKIRTRHVNTVYQELKAKNVQCLNEPGINPEGRHHFYLLDPYGNIFEVIEDDYWFTRGRHHTGGVCGVTIGVSDMDKSIEFYQKMLGMTLTLQQHNADTHDWVGLPLPGVDFQRAILKSPSGAQPGAFGKLLGPYQIELVQAKPPLTDHYFKNRFWGDLGYIHLCFDIRGYENHIKLCQEAGSSLTVDSGQFAMGDAAGRFSYNEDPDGTLLEYVETHKVPILKKIGWYLNLGKWKPTRHLPDWMVKALRFSRVK